MGEGNLELTIVKAEGLRNVNILGMGKMKPYTIAWMDPQYKKYTQQNSGTSPAWDETLILPVDTHLFSNPNATLIIQVLCTSPLKTKIIGTTTLMVSDIKRICSMRDRDEHETFALQLWRPSGRAYGILRVALKLKGSGLFEEFDEPSNRVVDGPHLSNWAERNHQTFDWAISNSHTEVQPCDVPVQGIPVASLYPTAPYMHPSPDTVSSGIGNYATPDEQFDSSNDSQPPPEQRPVGPSAPPVRQNEAPKNFLIGLLSGAVAAILVGSAVVGN